MPSGCCEFVDSRLRRSPPDRASAVPYGQAGENAMRFPRPCPQVGGCPQASQHPQQHRMNLISGNDQTSSRLPIFSLLLPESCPNNRDRRTIPVREKRVSKPLYARLCTVQGPEADNHQQIRDKPLRRDPGEPLQNEPCHPPI